MIATYVRRMASERSSQGDRQRIDSQRDLAESLKDPGKRAAALKALQESRDVEAVALLAGLSHKSGDPEVRAAALTALGDIGDPAGLPPIAIGCRDIDPAVRRAAVAAAGKLGTPTGHGALGEALSDVDAPVRETAARTLAGMGGDEAAVPGLLEALADEEKPAIRRDVAAALGRQKGERARVALVATLDPGREKEAEVRGVDPARPETLANVVGAPSGDEWNSLELACAFVNYPLDMTPRHPSTCCPLTYQARGKGFFMFRNRRRHADEIVFQLYAKENPHAGHAQNNAGALRLWAFGRRWTRETGERDAARYLDSVVLLPDNLTRENAGGRVTSWGTETHGSGHVTVDLSACYAPGVEPKPRSRIIDHTRPKAAKAKTVRTAGRTTTFSSWS